MKTLAFLLVIASAGWAIAQDPWPLERQDRWATGRAPVGPASYTTPWIFRTLNNGSPVSHPPSLGVNGTGYFGTWVNNFCVKMDYGMGTVLNTFNCLGFVTSTPAIAPGGGHVYPHADGGRLFAVNTTTMDYDWFWNTGGYAGSAVLGPEGDPVVSSSNGTCWRLNAATGIPVWTRPGLLQPAGPTIAFSRDDSLVFVTNGSRMTALNWTTGAVEWNFDSGFAAGSPGVAPDGTLVFGNAGGTVYGLNPATGAVIWSKQVLGAVQGPPAFSTNGVAYVASYDFRLYAYRVSDGFRLWSFTGNHENQKGPSVGADGRIYFFNRIGWLYALNPDGTVSWIRNFPNGEARGGISIDADGTLYLGANAPGKGLVIIKQQAIALPFSILTMEIGDLVSGGAGQALASDDQYIQMKTSNIFTFGRTDPQIRARLDLDSDYDRLSKFTLKFEAAASLGNSVQQKVEMFNFQANAYEVVDVRPSTAADSAWELTVTSNATRFVEAGSGVMRLRASWFIANGPRTWTARIDQATLVDVVPEW